MTSDIALAADSERPLPGQRVYTPHGSAETLFYSRDREVVVDGPAGTGKSRACLEKLNLCALKYPGMRALMMRKTRKSLTQSAMVTFEQKVLPERSNIRLHHESQEYRYPNGSRIVVGGLGDADETTRVMSTEYDLIYVQEAREAGENEWEALTTRLRNGVMPYQQIIGDTNPDAPTHWIVQRSHAKRLRLIPSRHEDNPTVTPEYLATLDALTGVRYQRLRLGRWVAAEGLVYDGWDRAVHVVDAFKIPAEWPRCISVDFGYTNPFVAQWWAIDHDGRLYRYRELYYTQRLVEDHARQIVELSQGERIRAVICDWDAEGRATLERHALPRLGLRQTTQAFKVLTAGIQAVTARLRPAGDGKPRLVLLRDALVERDPSLDDKKLPACTEEEMDAYCFVAGTPVATAAGPKPIEHLAAGELVWTRQGLQTVAATGCTDPAARVWTVTCSDGRRLTGTGDHPVFVQGKGWVSLSSLSSADILATWDPKRSSSTGLPIAATPTQSDGVTVSTSALRRQHERQEPLDSTLICGSRSTGPRRPVAISTTTTEIHSTTPSTTSCALIPRPMLMPTVEIRCAGRPNGSPSWTLLDRSRQPGDAPTLAEHEPVNELSANGLLVPRASASVNNAASQCSVGSLAPSAFVPGHVTLLGERPERPTTKTERALSADASSPWTSGNSRSAVLVHVVSVVEEPSPAAVYNLTVEGCPEYFANGVLVHNCWDVSNGRKKGEVPVDKDNHGEDAARYMTAAVDLTPRMPEKVRLRFA